MYLLYLNRILQRDGRMTIFLETEFFISENSMENKNKTFLSRKEFLKEEFFKLLYRIFCPLIWMACKIISIEIIRTKSVFLLEF